MTEWQPIEPPEEGGAVCFRLVRADPSGREFPDEGFCIRHRGAYRAFLNRCPHAGSPLDWVPGRFFSEDGRFLVCHTHMALFEPDSGAPVSGPACAGLTPLPVELRDGVLRVPARIEAE